MRKQQGNTKSERLQCNVSGAATKRPLPPPPWPTAHVCPCPRIALNALPSVSLAVLEGANALTRKRPEPFCRVWAAPHRLLLAVGSSSLAQTFER